MVMSRRGYKFGVESYLQLAVLVANIILRDSDIVIIMRDWCDMLNKKITLTYIRASHGVNFSMKR